jgi:photosynthetic reaction center L subunit
VEADIEFQEVYGRPKTAQLGLVFGQNPFESVYRKPGNTLFGLIFGEDPFDFWAGPFYVGFFGLVAAAAIAIGVGILFVAVGQYGDWDLLRANVPPPTRAFGLGWAPFLQGGAWQAVVICATASFLAWGLREVDICRKLQMGFHIPAMFSLAISAWLILQIVRPFLMGCWCEGFDLSFTGHLTWVSNTGFRYINFYYNPFHAYAVLGFFLTAMVLAMHGSAILGTYNTDKDPNVEMRREDSFWRDYIGYSIGEYGIHRLGFYLAVFTLIMSDLCILTSGTLVQNWVDFWQPFK